MEKPVALPFYLKCSQIIVGLIGLFYVLYIGREIIIPLIFAVIIAILLNPVVSFLQRRRLNKIVAIIITMIVAIILIGGLVYFIGSQVSQFSDSLPVFKRKMSSLFSDVVSWISANFNISVPKIKEWLDETKSEGISSNTKVIQQTIGTIGGVLTVVLLLPVYVFMLLFYKPLLLGFFAMLFPHQKKSLAEVLSETKSLIQHYLVGLLMEAGIVATLLSVGLFLMGIDYALLMGVIGAMCNLIPYIGSIVATVLPVIVALTTKPPYYALLVIGLFILVQFIDNNLIVPKIVASRVEINALMSIIIVVTGGALWGIPGMFLAIPLTAIVKVIFDRIEPLKPIGFLLGENNTRPKKK